MKRFKFKLDRLLMIKEYVEMDAKLKFASELQSKLSLENENSDMKKSILECILNNYSSYNIGDNLNYNDLLFQEQYINSLIYKIKNNKNKTIEIEKRLIELREALNNAAKEKKKISNLKTKEYKKYKKESKKQDIKNIDEIAGQLIARNQKQE